MAGELMMLVVREEATASALRGRAAGTADSRALVLLGRKEGREMPCLTIVCLLYQKSKTVVKCKIKLLQKCIVFHFTRNHL